MHKYHIPFIISACILLSLCASAKGSLDKNQRNANALCFIANAGQVKDQAGSPRKDIQYKFSGNGVNIFIGNGQLQYQFTKIDKQASTPGEEKKPLKKPLGNISSVQYERIDVTLIGHNKNAACVAEDQQPYSEQYYLPGCNGAIAKTCKKITYKNIYPGIDWVLYIREDKLEYDFIVHSGANVNDIKIKYEGADSLSLENGNLVASNGLGIVTEQAPYAYEAGSGNTIATKFKLHKNVLGFQEARHRGDIVIDPKISWGTYYGGEKTDAAYSVACDTFGNVYMTGFTQSSNNIATTGAFKTSLTDTSSYNPNYSAFLVKFSPLGERLWGTYYGNISFVYGTNVTCDVSGNVYFSGSAGYLSSYADTTLLTSGVYFDTSTCCTFLVKFDSSGKRNWGAGYFDAENMGIVSDNYGNIYMTGMAYRRSSPDSIFVMKLNANGSKLWSVKISAGYASLGPSALTIDAFSNLLIIGQCNRDSLTTLGKFKGLEDALLVKMDTAGKILWSTCFGGSSRTIANGVATDKRGNIYISGTTENSDLPGTIGTFQPTMCVKCEQSGFLAKFNDSGTLQWGTYYGDTKINYSTINHANGVVCDTAGFIYLCGLTDCEENIATENSYWPNFSFADQGYIAKFSPNGQRLWGTYCSKGSVIMDLSPNAYETMGGITADKFNNIYVAGATLSADSIATPGAYQDTLNPGDTLTYSYLMSDAYLLKFTTTDTNLIINQPFAYTAVCTGVYFNLPYSIDHPLQAGNIFTAQLSDSTGSFASPVDIGSVTATGSDVINCMIPFSAPEGTQYRIRIVSSSPALVSTDDYYDITVVVAVSSVKAASKGPVCKGDFLNLTATSIPAKLIYQWSGPDSFYSSLQNPMVRRWDTLYAGLYTVTASAAGCAPVTDTVSAKVYYRVSLPLVSADSPSCAGSVLYLHATDTTIGVKYVWSGPYGITDSTPNPIIDTPGAGVYYVYARLGYCVSAIDSISIDTCMPLKIKVIPASSPKVILFPNPNSGTFSIQGSFAYGSKTAVIEIVNTAGQVIYKDAATLKQGYLDKEINIGNMAEGIYTSRITVNGESYVSRFVVSLK